MGFHTVRGFGTERWLAEAPGEGEVGFVVAAAADGEAPRWTVLPVHAAASTAWIRSTKLLRAQKVYPVATLYGPGSRGQKYVHRADGV